MIKFSYAYAFIIQHKGCVFISTLHRFLVSIFVLACLAFSVFLNESALLTSSASTLDEPSSQTSAEPIQEPEPEKVPVKTIDTIFSYEGLVDIRELDPTFVIDLKYAGADNFTGQVHYEAVLPLLHKDTARMLLHAQSLVAVDGYRIKIFDVYRPFHVQQSLYDATPADLKMFVAKPSKNALHCKGLAVDCTLVDENGEELSMPSPFDTFDERAYVNYTGGTKEERQNRDYLIGVMKECGFSVYSKEWWHYTAPNPDEYELHDITFTEFINLRDAYDKKQTNL